jgi:protein-L-isoaspartate(D-aspartate) O-methyltransferase
MVERQVRTADVTDQRIQGAMLEVPREEFVPEPFRQFAYIDESLKVSGPRSAGPDRYLMAPRPFARLVQLADVAPGDKVLDVGAATGYSTAVLARLAGSVMALEQDAALAEYARAALTRAGVANATVHVGPHAAGLPEAAPFDVIVIEGAVPDTPTGLLWQLKDGGRLVAIVSTTGFGNGTVWRRVGAAFDAVPAFDAGVPPLPGFEVVPQFVL